MRRLIAMFALLSVSTVALAQAPREYYTDADRAAIRARAQDPRYEKDVAALIRAADKLADLSDEDLWNLVPPADLTRALTVRYEFDCPVHGKEIYKVGGRFPWITSPDKPFKVECPVGHEVYPSNDFDAYLRAGRTEKLDTTKPYVDDGNGYVAADGNRYFFAGYYNFWQRWRRTLIDGTAALGGAYLATGDEKYARKAAIALAAISRVYPQMDYANQAYHNGKWPAAINGRILDYIWENQVITAFATSYAAIKPAIDRDESLRAFLKSKGIDDVRAAIERDIFQEQAKDLLAKKIWGNQFELRSIAMVALVLDNRDASKGITSHAMVDYLTRGGGELEYTFYNGFDRDGWGGESSLSYSNIWNSALIAAAEDLQRLGSKQLADPKWRRLVRAGLEMRLLDGLSPRIGDVDGQLRGNKQILSDDILLYGVAQFDDADCAKVLLRRGTFKLPLLSRYKVDEAKLKELATRATFPEAPHTRDIGGYGLAVLELNDGEATRSATLYYGSPMASHGHNDRLTMSLHIGDRDVFTEMGYPSQWGPVADWWIKNTVSHYAVTIDEEPQTSRYAGHLTKFVDAEGLKLAEAQARTVWQKPPPPAPVPAGSIGGEKKPTTAPAFNTPIPNVSDYRRMLALLDTGDRGTLVVEAYFVEGGKQHDYSFHGTPFGKFTLDGATLTKQLDYGTVADESIDHGGSKSRSGFQFLSKPRYYAPGDVVHASWRDDAGVNLDTWFPRLAFDEVIVADGVPPALPGAPENMPFVLLRRGPEQSDARSLFLSISETATRDTQVKRVTAIRSTNAKAGGAVVELASGPTWKLYINGADDTASFDDGAASSVSFAAIRYEQGSPALARLVGAGSIKTKDGVEASVLDAVPARVVSVDYAKHTVRVESPQVMRANDVGFVRRSGSPLAASYTVRGVDGDTLHFGDIPLIAGRFEAAWDPATRRIVSKERTGGVYNRFVAYSFIGQSVVSEDYSTTATITGYDLKTNSFTIDADDATATKFWDCDADGRAYTYIAEIAPGATLSPTPARTIDLKAGGAR